MVFTDGQETAPKSISDVSGLITSSLRIFAIGLGTPENLKIPPPWPRCAPAPGGSLLLTGSDEGDTFFLLAKYFLQILAGPRTPRSSSIRRATSPPTPAPSGSTSP